jgi:hypothetical protein
LEGKPSDVITTTVIHCIDFLKRLYYLQGIGMLVGAEQPAYGASRINHLEGGDQHEQSVGIAPTPEDLDLQEPPEELRSQDRELLADLYRKMQGFEPTFSEHTGTHFRNQEIAGVARPSYTTHEVRAVEDLLRSKGTFDLPLFHGEITVDGRKETHVFMAPTSRETSHGEMSEQFWICDQVEAGEACMELWMLDPERYWREGAIGRSLLFSTMHVMSTPNQLAKQQFVIEHREKAGQLDHPQITFKQSDLDATETLKWRHRRENQATQARWAYKALRAGFVQPDELSSANKQILADMVPYLDAAGYPNNDLNCSAWEEVAAHKRTSTTAVSAAMLAELHALMLSDNDGSFGFLEAGWRAHMPQDEGASFTSHIGHMIRGGLEIVGRQIPFEVPNPLEDPHGVRARGADATLLYLLRHGVPKLLADNQIPIGSEGLILTEEQIEEELLAALESLEDPVTGGIKRYEGDSYQRQGDKGFHTNTGQWKVRNLKQKLLAQSQRTGQPLDLDTKQAARNRMFDTGRQAMWTHGINGKAGWASHRLIRAIHERDEQAIRRNLDRSFRYLNQGLGLVTGEGEYHLAMQPDGNIGIEPTRAFRDPESYNTVDVSSAFDNTEGWPPEVFQLIIASPHSPLAWSAAYQREALGVLGIALERLQKLQLGSSAMAA